MFSAESAIYLDAEVWMVAKGVIEPVGEIGRTYHKGELDDLAFVVIFPQLYKFAVAQGCSAARYPFGVQDGGFFFVIK